jgi:RNA polymerase sigma-70 factor (ECF subfamily)
MDRCANVHGFAAVTAVEPMSTAQTDDELVAAVLGGDEAAFELLFERYRRSVTRLAYRFFYRQEQVEDIVQESFANAYFAFGSYRGGHEKSFIAWLSRITVRTCYDVMRRTRRAENMLNELSQDEEATLAARLRGAALGSEIESAAISRDLAAKLLQRLDPEDRLVLTLLNGADLSVREVSELTGWSPSKVKMRAHRARKVLQRVLHRYV